MGKYIKPYGCNIANGKLFLLFLTRKQRTKNKKLQFKSPTGNIREARSQTKDVQFSCTAFKS